MTLTDSPVAYEVDADGDPVWTFAEGEPIVPGRLAWSRLGVGHRCETWLAWSTDLWSPVVVKLPRPHQAEHPRARASLGRETRVLSRTTHPALPRLHEDGTAAVLPYIVLEHVDGVPLDEEVELHGQFDAPSAASLAAQLLAAVHAVHATGCAHLDVKTENVMLRDGRPVMVDLGSSRVLGSAQPPGQPVGTVGYAAPEMEECRPVSTSMDVYGVGVVLAEVLAETDGPLEPVVQALTQPDPARRADVSTAFALLENAIGPGALWPAWVSPEGPAHQREQPLSEREG